MGSKIEWHNQLSSSLSGKSSRACAPRLSFLFSAEIAVASATSNKFCNSNACVRTSIQDFESILSNILQDDHFRNLILQDGKTFLDENLANQGLASAKTIKFLDNL